jgi:hypothetical protein
VCAEVVGSTDGPGGARKTVLVLLGRATDPWRTARSVGEVLVCQASWWGSASDTPTDGQAGSRRTKVAPAAPQIATMYSARRRAATATGRSGLPWPTSASPAPDGVQA